jgi:L-fuculose-phosphate aldolase
MVLYTGGEVRVAEYAPFGTRELAEKVIEALRDRSAAILANRGVIACDRSLEEALEVLEVVERATHIYVLANAMGRGW